jgi:predicted esterase
MSEPSIGTIEQEFHTLCSQGQHAAAYELATREAGRFPESAQAIVYNWRFCTASLMGEPALALRLIEEALCTGHHYSAQALREDSDLAALHGLPEFERLVERSAKLHEQATTHAKPQLKVIVPDNGAAPYPLLLALHGNRSNIAGSERYWRAAAERGWLLALPQSSQAMGEQTYGWNDHSWAVREITQHAAAVREQYPVDQRRIAIAGFSMGGGLAAWLALSGEIPARGLIAVGPYLSNVDNLVPLLEAPRPQPLRAYLVASQRDTYCYAVAHRLAELLTPHGIQCELELHSDLGHDFPLEFERSLISGLNFIMQ